MKAETKQKVQKLDELLETFLILFPHPATESQIVEWPSERQLWDLRRDVRELVMTQRKKETFRTAWTWKAYELVDRRWPRLRLVKRLNELVDRARDRLKEASETELQRLRRAASEDTPKAKQLLKRLEAIQQDASKAAKIDWQDYKELLFKSGNPRLACDAEVRLQRSGFSYSDASINKPSRERCYARALEILADDLRYQASRDKARPLLSWIAVAAYDNLDYYDVVESNDMEWKANAAKWGFAEFDESERKKVRRAHNRERQSIHRLRGIYTRRERAMLAKIKYHKASGEFRSKVSEADFVQKFSR